MHMVDSSFACLFDVFVVNDYHREWCVDVDVLSTWTEHRNVVM
jgi:hypothetical protein